MQHQEEDEQEEFFCLKMKTASLVFHFTRGEPSGSDLKGTAVEPRQLNCSARVRGGAGGSGYRDRTLVPTNC